MCAQCHTIDDDGAPIMGRFCAAQGACPSPRVKGRAMKGGIALLLVGLTLGGCSTGSFGVANSAPPQPGSFGQTQQTAYGSNGMATTVSQIDPATGQRVVTGGSFSVGSGTASPAQTNAMLGNWTLSDSRAGSCTLSFSAAPLAATAGAMQASRSAVCSNEFSALAGWQVAGTGIVLTDAGGQLRGQLIPDNAGAFVGTVNTMFGPTTVRLSRGGA